MGFSAILFGHLKNCSFLIFSRTWCIGSQNTSLTAWVLADTGHLAKSLQGRLLLYQFDLKSILSWGMTLALPFPCYWSSSTLLYLSIWSMSWRILVTGFPVKDFHKPCLVGRPTLKELTAMSSTSPSISLYISQYLSEYVFRVSLSRMDKDSGESKGRETPLQVIKREPNAWVSSLKESMEPTLKPSNHLIATGSRLEGNTLHIKVSSLEWIAIL